MKYLLSCWALTFVCWLGVADPAVATSQALDVVLYEGVEYYCWPHFPKSLAKYLPGVEIPEFYGEMSSNWRGYVATWAIVNGQFYFMGVDGQARSARGRTLTSNRELFPTIKLPYRVSNISKRLALRRTITDRTTKRRSVRHEEIIVVELDAGKVVGTTRSVAVDPEDAFMLRLDAEGYSEDYDSLLSRQLRGENVERREETGEARDLVIYEGKRDFAYNLPTLAECLPGVKLPEFHPIGGGNHRGYRATWSVIDNRLYLMGIEANVRESDGYHLRLGTELLTGITFPHEVRGFLGPLDLTSKRLENTYLRRAPSQHRPERSQKANVRVLRQ